MHVSQFNPDTRGLLSGLAAIPHKAGYGKCYAQHANLISSAEKAAKQDFGFHQDLLDCMSIQRSRVLDCQLSLYQISARYNQGIQAFWHHLLVHH